MKVLQIIEHLTFLPSRRGVKDMHTISELVFLALCDVVLIRRILLPPGVRGRLFP